MKIKLIDQAPTYLKKIIDLGNKNKKTLGFLPEGAFKDYAEKGQILVAIAENNELAGYLLFRIVERGLPYRKAVIVHLAVAEKYRRTQCARSLISGLRAMGPTSFNHIQLSCRQDFPANKLWGIYGFQKLHVRAGRGRRGSKLDVWVMQLQELPLFAWIPESIDLRLRAVIDANILYRLQDSVQEDIVDPLVEEVLALQSDWVESEIELLITPEIFKEIERKANVMERGQRLNFAREFKSVSGDTAKVELTKQVLSGFWTQPKNPSTLSDISQLAYCIVGNVPYFITQDNKIIAKRETISKEFGVEIHSPGSFINKLDKVNRGFRYEPDRLAGSGISIRHIDALAESVLYDQFRCESPSERKTGFVQTLRKAISQPNENEVLQVSNHSGKVLALVAYCISNGSLDIELLRVTRSKLQRTLAENLVSLAIEKAGEKGIEIVRVTDTCRDNWLLEVLSEQGFFVTKGLSVRLALQTFDTGTHICERLSEIGKIDGYSELTSKVIASIEVATTNSDSSALINIERILGPMKIAEAGIPCYLIPIQPQWAQDLFDEKLARQTLLGAKEEVILRRENVYYSNSRASSIQFPARILWYVMAGGGYQNTKCIRASSILSEVVIGKPKMLFRKFQDYGVYTWNQVFEQASHDLEKELAVFRFESTELFDKPVELGDYGRILMETDGKGLFLQAPIAISEEVFQKVYKAGRRLSS